MSGSVQADPHVTLENLERLRKHRIELAALDFWEYCKLDDPDFFNDTNSYLRDLAHLLQAFFERRIRRVSRDPTAPHSGWIVDGRGSEVCKNLIINMPPRHGKTRIVSLFESWLIGRDINTKIICGSYNDDTAGDISRLVRNKISEESVSRWKATYGDIFPGVKLKSGDSSVKRWAVEGSYFNYLAAGVGGSATGKGCNIMVIDDPVKNAEQAFSKTQMAAVNSWINDTMLSRMEGDALFLIVMTRWPGGDICEDYMTDPALLGSFYQYSLPAHRGNGVMLNPAILNYETYLKRKMTTEATIFAANYDQDIIFPKGALYQQFQTYSRLPKDLEGNDACDAKLCYFDTADGGDYTVGVAAIEYEKNLYVTGVFYDDLPATECEPLAAEFIIQTGAMEVRFESNSGGKAFAQAVEAILRVKAPKVYVDWIHQSANKQSRILTNSANVQKRVIYPLDWMERWPEYSKAMMTYLRVGRNKNDDAPDATTGLVEFSDSRGVILL